MTVVVVDRGPSGALVEEVVELARISAGVEVTADSVPLDVLIWKSVLPTWNGTWRTGLRLREGRELEQLRDVVVAADVGLDGLAERLRELVVLADEAPHAELLLGLADEVLLARDAHEVRVGVAVAHVGQRVVAAQPLVAGLDVDRLVGGVGCR